MVRGTWMTLLLLAAVGCGPAGEDPDVGSAAYRGLLRNGELENNVRIVDRDSALDAEVGEAFRVDFDGEIEIYFLFVWREVSGGGWTDVTDIVERDDGTLVGSVTIEDITLSFKAEFSDDRQRLDVEVEKLGFLTLHRVEPEETTDEDTADPGDTATP
jgi:hypothetical protein